jgi:hypothetical protein
MLQKKKIRKQLDLFYWLDTKYECLKKNLKKV